MHKNNITAIILTKNEEIDLPRCLKNLKWCKQILVIDDYSEDKTVQIAKKYHAKVIKNRLNNNFSQQRNFALQHVTTEWSLFIDADEITPPSLVEEIKDTVKKEYPLAYRINRQDFFLGSPLKYGETSRWNQIRLAQTDIGKWIHPVHELWKINGTVGQLQNPIIHYSHHNLTEFLNKINFYSTVAAKHKYKLNKQSSKLLIITYPIAKFIKNYIFYFGILDGSRGFIHAICMSFHSYLVMSKLYLLHNKN